MRPLVTVLIPAYNHEKYIEQTIRSIINQTYDNIELIVINDGSSDKTWEIIQSMREVCERRFTKTIFLNQKNKGITKTLNSGIKMAEGKYIKSIASDDYLVPEAIEKFVSFAEQNADVELVFSDGFHIESEKLSNMDFSKNGMQKFSDLFDFKDGYLFDYLLTKVFFAPTTSVFYTKNLIERINYYDESLLIEDIDFFLRASKETKFYFLNDILVYHRIHPNNTGRNHEILIKTAELMLNKYDVEFCGGISNYQTLQYTLSKFLAYLPVKKIKEISKDKKIIIWGAGSFFSQYKDIIEFDYVVDTNTKIAKENWPDLCIEPPEKLLYENKEEIFIVVCSSFYVEIFNWLDQNGFKREINYL
jgi:alpha-1,3-rhamnosyltransferase